MIGDTRSGLKLQPQPNTQNFVKGAAHCSKLLSSFSGNLKVRTSLWTNSMAPRSFFDLSQEHHSKRMQAQVPFKGLWTCTVHAISFHFLWLRVRKIENNLETEVRVKRGGRVHGFRAARAFGLCLAVQECVYSDTCPQNDSQWSSRNSTHLHWQDPCALLWKTHTLYILNKTPEFFRQNPRHFNVKLITQQSLQPVVQQKQGMVSGYVCLDTGPLTGCFLSNGPVKGKMTFQTTLKYHSNNLLLVSCCKIVFWSRAETPHIWPCA